MTKTPSLPSATRFLFGKVSAQELSHLTPEQRELLKYQALCLYLLVLCVILTLVIASILGDQAAALGEWLRESWR